MFKPGESGNPAGRPKGTKDRRGPITVLEAFDRVIKDNPELLESAIHAGLESKRAFSFVEMGAKLKKEIGTQESAPTQIAIIFNGSLDPNKLKVIDAKVVSAMPSASSGFPSLPKGTAQEVLHENLQNEVCEQTALSKESEQV